MAEVALAIIPARRGSKRLAGKNTRLFCGKPLLQWSIDVAQACTSIDRVLVTSDDPEVLAIARAAGVDYIVERPAELASDTASSMDVVMHAVQAVESEGEQVGEVCLLQPTSPLRSVEDVDAAFALSRANDGASVVSVCELEHPHRWSAPLETDLTMAGFVQSLRAPASLYYRLNGAVYLASSERLKQAGTFLEDASLALKMPRERSVDIDDELGFVTAEAIRKHFPALDRPLS